MERQKSLPLAHWGLECWPFPSALDVDQFYPTAGHTEALARIDYLVESQRRLGVLLGAAGVGKSLVLQAASRQLSRQSRAVVHVDVLGRSVRELLWQFACGLGAAPREEFDVARVWRLIADRILENRVQGVHTVLLVDEAGKAGPDMLTQLARLARLDLSPAARWTMVLTAEPAQAARWDESLRDLVDLRVELSSWSSEDTIGFVQTALLDAGRFEPLFDDQALATLYELTLGVPRQIVRLADYALLAGAAAGLDTIGATLVEAAHDEITWPSAAAVF